MESSGSNVLPGKAGELFRVANLEFRPQEFEVLADGRRVGLTVRECQLLLVLVWGGQMAYRDRSVDVFVRKVRQKLATAASNWNYIHTHFGVGYRFSPERVAG